jgi:hypothetical protein
MYSSGDDHLYTITTNSVFRIYAPVIDDPTWFQLLSSLDGRAFSTSASAKGKDPASLHGTLVPLDARVIQSALQRELVHQKSGGLKISAHAQKLLTGLQGEEGDVIAWFGRDGTVSFRSIVVSTPVDMRRSFLIFTVHRISIGNRRLFSKAYPWHV